MNSRKTITDVKMLVQSFGTFVNISNFVTETNPKFVTFFEILGKNFKKFKWILKNQ